MRLLILAVLVTISVLSCASAPSQSLPTAPIIITPTADAASLPSYTGANRRYPVPPGVPWAAPNSTEVAVVSISQGPAAEQYFADLAPRFRQSPPAGKKVVVVTVWVRDMEQGDRKMTVGSNFFSIVGSSATVFNRELLLIKDFLGGEIYAGGAITGNLAFFVPADERDMLLIYEPVVGRELYFALSQ